METIENITRSVVQVSFAIISACGAIFALCLLVGFVVGLFSDDEPENSEESEGS